VLFAMRSFGLFVLAPSAADERRARPRKAQPSGGTAQDVPDDNGRANRSHTRWP
jgi:hypothetical protein